MFNYSGYIKCGGMFIQVNWIWLDFMGVVDVGEYVDNGGFIFVYDGKNGLFKIFIFYKCCWWENCIGYF